MADQEVVLRWMKARIDTIHQRVTAHDILQRHGISLRYTDREEQFSCPFHGTDTKPSARVYVESSRSPSHVWCFVCQERWDCIALWKKFEGFEGTFGRLLRGIERDFGITPPEGPPPEEAEAEEDLALAELQHLCGICERRLRSAKPLFDMKSYLVLGTILDRLYTRVDERIMTPEKAKETTRLILDKIGAKERAV